MRLLDVHRLQVEDVFNDSVPEYAILSHTWGLNEVTFQDLQGLVEAWISSPEHSLRVTNKKGFSKLKEAARLASEDGYNYIWIDTCCIDKSSSAELSEAINSMYRWYEEAAVCYAYVSDVQPMTDITNSNQYGDDAEKWASFRSSRWFTRGWTLQELIAPKDIRFYAQDWSFIGNKKGDDEFKFLLSQTTGIDHRVLEGILSPQDLSVSTRMQWASMRQTTRLEDVAYCLMGIFGVNMPLLYGEGKRAFIRLQEELLRETDDQSLFAWTSEKEEDQSTDRLCGLLADSPLLFKDVGHVRPLPPLLTRDSVPSSITNQGLRIQLYLKPVVSIDKSVFEEEYHAILDCSVIDRNIEYCPTIFLRKLWGDQFARVRSRESGLLHPPTEDNESNEGYQTVYVKQRPVYIMPEFTLASRDVRSLIIANDRQNYILRQVHPTERWDFNSMSLKSIYSQLNRVMGVFRFSDPYQTNTQVDIAVGFRRVNQKRWESWCSQRRCSGEPLDQVFRSFEETLTSYIEDVNLSGSLLSHYLSLGQDNMVLSDAKVIETQMHGRSYIYLQVFTKAQIDTSAELQFIPKSTIYESLDATIEQITAQFTKEVQELTTPCSIQDLVQLSILAIAHLTTKVRITHRSTQPTSASIDFLKDIISSMGPKQMTIRNIKSSSKAALSSELLYACKMGDESRVKSLLKSKALIESQTEKFHDFRPIHWAAIGGHFSIVILLLGAGAYDYSITSQGLTALHLAAMMGHSKMIMYFLEKAGRTTVGIDDVLGARTIQTLETPLHLAAAYVPQAAAEEVFKSFYAFSTEETFPIIHPRNYLDETPLHRAAAMNNAEHLLRKIDEKWPWRGTDFVVEPVDKFARTPLWHAACAGASDSIRAFASHGAQLNLADDLGRTPLHAACMGGKIAAIRALLDLGADPNIATPAPGLTACHYAALFGHSDCLELLFQKGARHLPTHSLASFRPIHLAVANGWLNCLKVILAAVAQPNSPSTHYILLEGTIDATGSLIAHKAHNPEELAVALGQADIIRFFEERKAEQEKLRYSRGLDLGQKLPGPIPSFPEDTITTKPIGRAI